MLLDELGVLVNVLEMHLLDLPLQLLFFFVEPVHILAHELLDIDVFVACAHGRFISAGSMRARPFSAQICRF